MIWLKIAGAFILGVAVTFLVIDHLIKDMFRR